MPNRTISDINILSDVTTLSNDESNQTDESNCRYANTDTVTMINNIDKCTQIEHKHSAAGDF